MESILRERDFSPAPLRAVFALLALYLTAGAGIAYQLGHPYGAVNTSHAVSAVRR